jgi:hypothetical protein
MLSLLIAGQRNTIACWPHSRERVLCGRGSADAAVTRYSVGGGKIDGARSPCQNGFRT